MNIGEVAEHRGVSLEAKKNRFVKHKIEVFCAGCKICKDAIEVVRRLAGSEHEVVVHDMHQSDVSQRAELRSVRSVPAVMVDGILLSCCVGGGVEEDVLREALR